MAFLNDQRLNFWEDGDRMGCSAQVRRQSLLVSAKWLIEFRFREALLTEVGITMGITGP